jgi:hypothetical protein
VLFLPPPMLLLLQRSLATSNISNKLRASNLEASRQKGGRQTQLLDMPVQLAHGHNGGCLLLKWLAGRCCRQLCLAAALSHYVVPGRVSVKSPLQAAGQQRICGWVAGGGPSPSDLLSVCMTVAAVAIF